MSGFQEGFQNSLSGLALVQDGIAQGQERKRKNTLASLSADYANGGQPDYQGIAANGGDPLAFRKDQQEQEKALGSRVGQIAGYLASIPDANMRNAAYQQARPQLEKFSRLYGLPLPDSVDDTHLPELKAISTHFGSGTDKNQPMNVAPGGEVFDPVSRTVLHANTNFAPPKPQYDASRGMFVTGPDSPQGPGAVQVAPARPDYEAQRLALAQQAATRADQAARDAADARRFARQGTAPAGQRFNDQGALEAIPGYQPPSMNKPMPPAAMKLLNEEREKVQTSANINANIDKWAGWLKAGKLPLGMIDGPVSAGKNFLGWSDEGSRNYASFKAGLEKMRNDSLRLNSGVQTEGDATRAWNELLANINDEDLVSQRLAEIRDLNSRALLLHQSNVEATLENYGRPVPGAVAPPANVQRARNAAGQVIELRNGQWVPVQ